MTEVISWLNLFCLITLGLLIKFFIPGYLQKKAENLATKEDLKAITTKVESIKASVGAQLYIHQFRYQNEFKILMDLSEKLVALRDATTLLRPIVDSYASQEPETERKQRRLSEWRTATINFYKKYEAQMPFYPEEIYQAIRELELLTRKEAIEYDLGPEKNKGHDKAYWDSAETNALKISALADKAIQLIRARVKHWEEFKIKE